jgi:hypothetical protein
LPPEVRRGIEKIVATIFSNRQGNLRRSGAGGKMPSKEATFLKVDPPPKRLRRMSTQRFASFHEFYPFYLREHSSRASRRLHVIGTTLALALALGALVTQQWVWLWGVPVAGYALAWVGHFLFEKNSPATFRHPLYSLMGDFAMVRDVLTGRIRW